MVSPWAGNLSRTEWYLYKRQEDLGDFAAAIDSFFEDHDAMTLNTFFLVVAYWAGFPTMDDDEESGGTLPWMKRARSDSMVIQETHPPPPAYPDDHHGSSTCSNGDSHRIDCIDGTYARHRVKTVSCLSSLVLVRFSVLLNDSCLTSTPTLPQFLIYRQHIVPTYPSL